LRFDFQSIFGYSFGVYDLGLVLKEEERSGIWDLGLKEEERK
jgi:hypothetical protein